MICQFHLTEVRDDQTLRIIDRDFTFFDIRSTKAKQFGYCLQLDAERKLTCCGDEPYSQHLQKYAQDSDWLLHEAFCLYSQAAVFDPYEKHHSTVKDACQLAQRLNVKNLLLYHTEDKKLNCNLIHSAAAGAREKRSAPTRPPATPPISAPPARSSAV